ncbi:hypothetical protein D3C80_2222070 [compost metagenome]
MQGRGDLLPESLFDDGLPWHQTESLTIIEHGITSTGEYDATPVDACHALAIKHWSVL